MLTLPSLALAASSSVALSQPNLTLIADQIGSDTFRLLAITPAGPSGNQPAGFVAVGYTGPDSPVTDRDIVCVRYDDHGVIRWAYAYGLAQTAEHGTDVVATADGGFAIAAAWSGFLPDLEPVSGSYIIKVDPNGTMLWAKSGTGAGLDLSSANTIVGPENLLRTSTTMGLGIQNDADGPALLELQSDTGGANSLVMVGRTRDVLNRSNIVNPDHAEGFLYRVTPQGVQQSGYVYDVPLLPLSGPLVVDATSVRFKDLVEDSEGRVTVIGTLTIDNSGEPDTGPSAIDTVDAFVGQSTALVTTLDTITGAPVVGSTARYELRVATSKDTFQVSSITAESITRVNGSLYSTGRTGFFVDPDINLDGLALQLGPSLLNPATGFDGFFPRRGASTVSSDGKLVVAGEYKGGQDAQAGIAGPLFDPNAGHASTRTVSVVPLSVVSATCVSGVTGLGGFAVPGLFADIVAEGLFLACGSFDVTSVGGPLDRSGASFELDASLEYCLSTSWQPANYPLLLRRLSTPLDIGETLLIDIALNARCLGDRQTPATPEYCAVCCNLADVVSVGGGELCDGQLTVDDVIAFVNAFGDATNCPGSAPCNIADITDVGNTGNGPDGQLTVDDFILFVNLFGEGCGLQCVEL